MVQYFVGADIFGADAGAAALGGPATYQTNRAENQDVRIGALALQALTEQAANQKRPVHSARSRNCTPRRVNCGQCSDKFGDLQSRIDKFRRRERRIQFYRSPSPSGIMICSSRDQIFDATNGPNFADLMDTKSRSISVIPDRQPNGASHLSVMEPFEVDGAFAGKISISPPHRNLQQLTPDFANLGFVDFMTTDEIGDIVTTREGSDTAAQDLPFKRSRGQLDCSR